MFKKIKRILRKRKNKPAKLKKAGLREHINERKASGKTKRVYTNKNGEKFVAERQEGRAHTGNPSYNITITKHGDRLPYAEGMIILNEHTKQIEITGLGLHETDAQGSGRNFLGIVVDECKQIGLKTFGKKEYEIRIYSNNPPVKKYYIESGFKKMKDTNTLTMKVKKGK